MRALAAALLERLLRGPLGSRRPGYVVAELDKHNAQKHMRRKTDTTTHGVDA